MDLTKRKKLGKTESSEKFAGGILMPPAISNSQAYCFFLRVAVAVPPVMVNVIGVSAGITTSSFPV